MYVYIYIYIHIFVYIYIYIHTEASCVSKVTKPKPRSRITWASVMLPYLFARNLFIHLCCSFSFFRCSCLIYVCT